MTWTCRSGQRYGVERHVQVISNHNHFVGYGRDPGAIGIKTGYTVAAHSTIVAAQRRGGRTLIAVALGTDHMYNDVRSMFAYSFGTRSSAHAGSGSVRLIVGGRMPSRSASTVATPSTAPAAPNRWPIIDLD